MQVRFKKLHADAVIPNYAKVGDAGLDLVAVSRSYDPNTDQFVYSTGLATEIPEGHVGFLFPRSSVFKSGLSLTNAVGVIDSGYRGPIGARFYRVAGGRPFEVGERICQLVIVPFPMIEPIESEELSDTERGATGFGSSGR